MQTEQDTPQPLTRLKRGLALCAAGLASRVLADRIFLARSIE